MDAKRFPAPRSPTPHALTAPEFHQLAQVPLATEWFANTDNPNTRRAYHNDVKGTPTLSPSPPPARVSR
ncbi:hypothetical protein B1A_08103, partial [mine drainage metagenome]